MDLHDEGTALDHNKQAMLKVYDRRFSKLLRRFHGSEIATKETEEDVVKFVESGEAAAFLDEMLQHPGEGLGDSWEPPADELFLHEKCLERFEYETQAYHKLKELQGYEIPHLLAEGRLQLSSSQESIESMTGDEEFFQVKAILIEFIDGYMLEDMLYHAPKEDWVDIVDESVRIVRLMDDYNLLKGVFRRAFVMVSPQTSEIEEFEYRIVFIDFGLCRFRYDEETDKKWGRRKFYEGGEEAIGLVMQDIMKRQCGYEYDFTPSGKYDEFAEKEFEERSDDDGFPF